MTANAKVAFATGRKQRLELVTVQIVAAQAIHVAVRKRIGNAFAHRMGHVMFARVALGTKLERRFLQIGSIRGAVRFVAGCALQSRVRIGNGQFRTMVRIMALDTKAALSGGEQVWLVRGVRIMTLLTGGFRRRTMCMIIRHGLDLSFVALRAHLLPTAFQRIAARRSRRNVAHAALTGGKRLVLLLHHQLGRVAAMRVVTSRTLRCLRVKASVFIREGGCRFVATQAHVGLILPQQAGITRSMRIVTTVALSLLDRTMRIRTCQPLLDLGVATRAKFLAGFLQEVSVIGCVRIVALRTVTLTYRLMHADLRRPARAGSMAVCTEGRLLGVEQLHVARCMRIVARAALAVLQRLVHVRHLVERGHVAVAFQAGLALIYWRKLS